MIKLKNMDFITKTNAKNEYFLTEEELSKIEFIERPNPYRKSRTMSLYKCDEIMKFLHIKYNVCSNDQVKEIIKEIKNKKDEKKQKYIQNKSDKKQKRKYKLLDALQQYGLKLRSDSKLCQGYIDGTIKDKSIDWIANRMCQIKYLYDYCNMRDEIEKAKKEQIEERLEGYFPDCSVFDQAEMNILRRIGNYPNEFPWMMNR
jgi:hypothetical protein